MGIAKLSDNLMVFILETITKYKGPGICGKY